MHHTSISTRRRLASFVVCGIAALTFALAYADSAFAVADGPDLWQVDVAEGDVLNVRSRPHHEAPIVGELHRGELVRVLDESENGWRFAAGEKTTGWVNGRYLIEYVSENDLGDAPSSSDGDVPGVAEVRECVERQGYLSGAAEPGSEIHDVIEFAQAMDPNWRATFAESALESCTTMPSDGMRASAEAWWWSAFMRGRETWLY